VKAPKLPAEQAALLRAIVAHTEEDTPRLVYADWLQEHGDAEQAQFIRDSIKLAGMKKGARGRNALAKRVKWVGENDAVEWYDSLGFDGAVVRVEEFERGFPARLLFVGPVQFFKTAEVIFAHLPIRGIEISGGSKFRPNGLAQLGAVPELARLTDLRLGDHSQFGPKEWRKLFRSPHLAGLTYLALPGCGIYDAEAQELASAPPLANLTEIDLGYNSIGVDGARAILESPYLTKLKALWLEHNFFGEEDGEDEVLEALEERLGRGLHVHDSPYDDEDDG
jgi:uncharacterized protein (TIGR02996 family)